MRYVLGIESTAEIALLTTNPDQRSRLSISIHRLFQSNVDDKRLRFSGVVLSSVYLPARGFWPSFLLRWWWLVLCVSLSPRCSSQTLDFEFPHRGPFYEDLDRLGFSARLLHLRRPLRLRSGDGGHFARRRLSCALVMWELTIEVVLFYWIEGKWNRGCGFFTHPPSWCDFSCLFDGWFAWIGFFCRASDAARCPRFVK